MATATTSGARGLDAIAAPTALTSPARRRGRVSRGHLVMALAGVVGVVLSFEVLATVAKADDRRRFEGRIAGTTIAAGELVTSRTLRRRAAPHGLRAMSIPIDPSRAVGGRLSAGDHVDVLFAGQEAVSIIVADAPVLAVDARGRGGIGESSSPFTVTIAVDAPQSQLVAAAVADGEISLARTTGADSARGTAPASLDRVTIDDGSTG